MASPYAAGVAALTLEFARRTRTPLTPARAERLLEATGVMVRDYRLPSGSPAFPRVSPPRAMRYLTPRPDVRIRRPGGAWKGDDVYGGPRRQTVAVRTRVRRTARFVVTLQNDARFAERLRVHGAGSARGYRVRYFDAGGADITRRMVDGRLRTPRLAPGRTYRLEARVRVTRRTNPGSMVRREVTATSTRLTAATDTVALKMRRG